MTIVPFTLQKSMNCKIFQAPRNALRDWFVMQTLFNAHEVTHTSLCCHMLIAQLSLLNCPCPKRVHFLSRAWVLGQPCPEIMCFLVVVLICGVSVWFVGCFLVNKKNNNNLTDSNARFQVSRRHLVKKKKKKTLLYTCHLLMWKLWNQVTMLGVQPTANYSHAKKRLNHKSQA